MTSDKGPWLSGWVGDESVSGLVIIIIIKGHSIRRACLSGSVIPQLYPQKPLKGARYACRAPPSQGHAERFDNEWQAPPPHLHPSFPPPLPRPPQLISCLPSLRPPPLHPTALPPLLLLLLLLLLRRLLLLLAGWSHKGRVDDRNLQAGRQAGR